MARHIAFLRGINVGGHTVKMPVLRQLFEALDLDDVATFIASGNVIFTACDDSATLAPRIEAHLARELGYEVRTFLRSDAELAAIAAYDAFPDVEPSPGDTSYVAFLDHEPSRSGAAAVAALSNDTDRVVVHGRELHWYIRGKLADSTLGAPVFEKALGKVQTTVRNLNTVRRLADKYPPGAP